MTDEQTISVEQEQAEQTIAVSSVLSESSISLRSETIDVTVNTDYEALENKPSINGIELEGDLTSADIGIDIPTAVSELTNDAGYLTEHQSLSNYYTITETDALLADKADSDDIPTAVSELTNDAGYLTEHQDLSDYAQTADLADVATSGSYNDLSDTPTIPTVPTTLSSFTDDLGSSPVHTHSQYLTSHQSLSAYAKTADLATVATSGSYEDLSDTPTIPTVPTTLSSFTDDLGSSPTHTHSQYLTSHQDISGKSDVGHTHTRAESNDALVSATYTGVLRSSTSYSSPYTPSYFYFGQAIPTDLDLPSHFTYHIVAYATSNSNYLLDAVVRWDLSTNGIYKAYWIWNNNNSTSYYPFGYHSLYRSNNATISASDGCYFGGYFGTSTSYGQNPTTLERTFEVEVLEAENCTVSLTDSVIFFDDTDNMPTNLVHTSTSYAYNTSNFTVVNVTVGTGLQETGDGNTNYYDRMVWGYSVLDTAAASGRYSIGFVTASGGFVGIAQTSSTGTSKTLNTTVEIDPNLCFYQLTTTYAASKTIGASALYSRFNSVDIRYSCNQGSWMTARQPVYIKLSMAEDGFFTIDSTPFTHTLPTSADGYYYKFIGIAYDTYRLVFEPKETLYYHDGTKLCRY